nr:(2Fe-2S)-binding protein [Hyphomicrobium sp. CS1BSMeth3]
MFRLLTDPTDEFVRITIDGVDVSARKGEPVAAVLLRTAPFTARTTTVTGAPRAPYCLMGACFDCMAIVDGVASQRTCMIAVCEGMRVVRQQGKRTQTP